jgi:hypothetical protein
MGFRDDNEALRARTKAAEDRARRAETERERMERELAEAKANDDADAKRIAALEERLAKLDPGSLEAAKTQAAGRMRMALVGVSAAVALVMGLLVFFLVGAGSKKDGDVSMPAAAATTAEAPAAEPPPTEAEPASPLERVRLAGVVRSVGGVEGLEEGDGCVADLGIAEGWSQLQVRCGAGDRVATIYEGSEAQPMGIIQVSDQAQEASTTPGHVTRTMSYSRTGQWSGPPPQIQIDPDQHATRVWLQGIEARDVLLHIASSDFGPGVVPTLDDGGTGTIARGTIAKLAVQGEVPGALGELNTEDCVLRTEPQPRSGAGALTARIVARCGERILYGAGRSGWVPAPAHGEIMGPVEDPEMSAADTDPAITFAGDTLTIVEPNWRIVFDIEPHPKCTLAEGSWVGTLRDAEGQLQTGVSLTDGELTLPDGEVLTGTEDMRCHEGVARWTTEDGTTMLDGHFGPSFATYVGHLGTGQLIELYRH